MEPIRQAAKIKYAATIILSRGPDHDPEVYLARRAPEIRFFGDYWVFPGGNLSDIDYHHQDEDLSIALQRCAIREAFEEIDILSATTGIQTDHQQKKHLRQALLDKSDDWQNFLADADLNLTPVFRITTPPFTPVLFDTQFMHVRALDDETPQIDNHELVEGNYVKPAEALHAWRQG
jgi:8-oxo-dGTP pyrophosphatase MutT (NUDIX family)